MGYQTVGLKLFSITLSGTTEQTFCTTWNLKNYYQLIDANYTKRPKRNLDNKKGHHLGAPGYKINSFLGRFDLVYNVDDLVSLFNGRQIFQPIIFDAVKVGGVVALTNGNRVA